MTKGIEMKKFALLSMLLGMGMIVGCGETPKPTKTPPATPPVQNTAPSTESTESTPPKDGDEMPAETTPDETAPADDKPADDAAPADDKGEEKPE